MLGEWLPAQWIKCPLRYSYLQLSILINVHLHKSGHLRNRLLKRRSPSYIQYLLHHMFMKIYSCIRSIRIPRGIFQVSRVKWNQPRSKNTCVTGLWNRATILGQYLLRWSEHYLRQICEYMAIWCHVSYEHIFLKTMCIFVSDWILGRNYVIKLCIVQCHCHLDSHLYDKNCITYAKMQ